MDCDLSCSCTTKGRCGEGDLPAAKGEVPEADARTLRICFSAARLTARSDNDLEFLRLGRTDDDGRFDAVLVLDSTPIELARDADGGSKEKEWREAEGEDEDDDAIAVSGDLVVLVDGTVNRASRSSIFLSKLDGTEIAALSSFEWPATLDDTTSDCDIALY